MKAVLFQTRKFIRKSPVIRGLPKKFEHWIDEIERLNTLNSTNMIFFAWQAFSSIVFNELCERFGITADGKDYDIFSETDLGKISNENIYWNNQLSLHQHMSNSKRLGLRLSPADVWKEKWRNWHSSITTKKRAQQMAANIRTRDGGFRTRYSSVNHAVNRRLSPSDNGDEFTQSVAANSSCSTIRVVIMYSAPRWPANRLTPPPSAAVS